MAQQMPPRPSHEDLGKIKSKLHEILSKYPVKLNPKINNKPAVVQESVKQSGKRPNQKVYSSKQNIHPSLWNPAIIIEQDGVRTIHKLSTRVITPSRFGNCEFVLEDIYTLLGQLPRSYFSVLQEYQHSFVFTWPNPDSHFFQELAGLRKV